MTHYLGNQPQPVLAFLDSLSSEVKLQGAGGQRNSPAVYTRHSCGDSPDQAWLTNATHY